MALTYHDNQNLDWGEGGEKILTHMTKFVPSRWPFWANVWASFHMRRVLPTKNKHRVTKQIERAWMGRKVCILPIKTHQASRLRNSSCPSTERYTIFVRRPCWRKTGEIRWPDQGVSKQNISWSQFVQNYNTGRTYKHGSRPSKHMGWKLKDRKAFCTI